MSSDEEPPELEDMTETLHARNAELKEKADRREAKKKLDEERKERDAGVQDKKFGAGLKRGFFDQPKKKPGEKKLPLVKAKQPNQKPLEIPEVQAAMDYTMQNQSEWLTPDLLQKFMQNPALQAGFQNPRFMQAIEDMRKDPEAAKRKYAGDYEVQMFMVEFGKIMGGHFEELGKRKEEAWESDPEVQEILADPQISAVLNELKAGRPIDFHSILQSNELMAVKMRVLIDKGVINLRT